MKLGRAGSEVGPISKEHPPSRRLNEPPVLIALAAVMVGVASLALLLASHPPVEDPDTSLPAESSAEAGFVRDMSVHHAQAVRMAEAVRDRTEDPAIRVLATDVVLTQQAEIGQMRGWLEVWGLPASSSEPPMAWMGHPTTGPMPGMATPEDLARLHQVSAEEADEQFLRLMIPHHQAAIPMAEAVLERTDRPEVRRLAQKIVTSQQAEIRGMQALLQRKGLPPVEGEVEMPADVSTDEDHSEGGHSGDGHEGHTQGFTASTSVAAWDTVRLATLPLAVLAAAWLVLDALRRRRGGLAIPADAQSLVFWRAVAVAGLTFSAALHVGLAPTHFEEATVHGIFFAAAGVTLAVAAAAVLAWPSRPTYLAGAGISLALIVLWAVFRFVPPPGSEAGEGVDLVGLLTKATELVAAVACTVLWLRARNVYRRKQEGADKPATVDDGRA